MNRSETKRSMKPTYISGLGRNFGFTSLLAFNKDSFDRGERTKLSKQIKPLAAILNKSWNLTFFVTKTNTKPAKRTSEANHRTALRLFRILRLGIPLSIASDNTTPLP